MIAELEKPTGRTARLGGGTVSGQVGKKRGRPKKIAVAETSAQPNIQPYIMIDHPNNGERIYNPNHYAVRIGANGGESVEISIDDSEWKHCRHAGGYFWYDWHGISQGRHKIVARLKLLTGKFKKSKITRVDVL